MKRLLAAFLLFAVPALAGTGISGITVTKGRNLTSVAIQASISGDDDSSAVLRIFQSLRGQGNSYDTGMVMVRRVGSKIHDGRILWMEPGQTARFFIEAVDGNDKTTTPEDTASCAVRREHVATGPVIYVSKSGADANPGTLASPNLTIGGGLADLKASADSGAFGGVIVAPGEYHERIDLNFGFDGKPRFITGDRTNRDSTIICGAEPNAEAGKYGTGVLTSFSWASYKPNDPADDSIYVTVLGDGTAAGAFYADSIRSVILGWGEYLHRKTSTLGMADDSTATAGCGSCTNQGETSGWWVNSAGAVDSLFVKRRNGTSPAGSVFHLGYRPNLVQVWAPNWSIKNLAIRYGGGPADDMVYDAKQNAGENGRGIHAGFAGNAPLKSNNLVVDSVSVYGCNAAALVATKGAGVYTADSVTVTNSYFDGLSIGSWFYSAAKSRSEENANQVALGTSNFNFFRNTITGTFNGIGIGTVESDSLPGRFSELSYNRITNLSDDGIELDVAHGINTLVQSNLIHNAGTGISVSPCYTGPFFVFYNTLVNNKFRGIKTAANLATVKAYQNTVMSNSLTSCPAYEDAGSASVGFDFQNNILHAKKGTAVVSMAGSGVSTTLNSFNYNLWDSTATTRLANVNGTAYSFPTVQTSLGWEANGYRESIAFADTIFGHINITPSRTSRALTMGRRITGVNTTVHGNKRWKNCGPIVGSQDGSYGCTP